MKTALVLMIILFGVCFRTLAQAEPMIIDHTCTDINQIPQQWIEAAKTNLRISYGHTSHGSQLVTGIDAIRDFKRDPYNFTYSSGYSAGIFLNDQVPSGDLGNPDRTTWAQLTRTFLSQPGNDRNVVMWSWCGQVDGTEAEINTYLNLMNQLEQDFPSVNFIYMTGHLNGTGATGNVNRRNEQIRYYARNHNKILFDFADIESYDPDGLTNYMELFANDNCDYQGGHNWANDWMNANPTSALVQIASQCGSCAHSQTLNCVLKGGAFWWLMARLAGWGGGDDDDNITLTIAKAGAGSGTVTSDPPGIDCGADCAEAYIQGTVVTLTAASDTGSVFNGWSGAGCSGTGACEVTVKAGTTVRAVFTLTNSPVELFPEEGTIGTEIIFAGSGFGTKKGKVIIGGKSANIAKDGWSDTMITCTVAKVLPPGEAHDATIMIQPYKDATPMTVHGAFTVMNPQVDSLSMDHGIPGTRINISGSFFGTKKGKLYIEDPESGKKKTCRVTSWSMDPTNGESRLTFVVPKLPKSLNPGVYLLKINNKIGTTETTFRINP